MVYKLVQNYVKLLRLYYEHSLLRVPVCMFGSSCNTCTICVYLSQFYLNISFVSLSDSFVTDCVLQQVKCVEGLMLLLIPEANVNIGHLNLLYRTSLQNTNEKYNL